MLTAKGQTSDKITGLDAGAEDLTLINSKRYSALWDMQTSYLVSRKARHNGYFNAVHSRKKRVDLS